MKWLAVALALVVVVPVAASEPPVIAWFEIPVSDLDRATRFYGAVFGKSLVRERVDDYEMAMFAGANGPEGALVKEVSMCRERPGRSSISG